MIRHETCSLSGMALQDELVDWENLSLAYRNAARGKRGRGATAAWDLPRGGRLGGLPKAGYYLPCQRAFQRSQKSRRKTTF